MIHEAIDILLSPASYTLYSGKIPQSVQLPYVNHFQVSKDNSYGKDGANTKVIRYQVSVFSKSKSESYQIGNSIITILDGFSGHVSGVYIEQIRQLDENDLYEDEADCYHKVIDLEIRYK